MARWGDRRGFALVVVASSVLVILALFGLNHLSDEAARNPVPDKAADAAPDSISPAPPGSTSRDRQPEPRPTGDGDPASPLTPGDGFVRGTLVLPSGVDAAEFAILTRYGLLLHREPGVAGAFEIAVPEYDREDLPLYLWAEAEGCHRAEVTIPSGGGDVGTLVPRAGRIYHGWLMDELGRPVPGVIVQLSSIGRSLPSAEDGSFRISLKHDRLPDTVSYLNLEFAARGAFYGPINADSTGLGGGHRVLLGKPGSAPQLRLVRAGDGEPVAGVEVRLMSDFNTVLDRDVTSEDGHFDPHWGHFPAYALLELREPVGDLYVLLDRDEVHAYERVDVEIPLRDDLNRYVYRFIDGEKQPVVDTELRLQFHINGRPFLMDVRTDAEGCIGFHLDCPEKRRVSLSRGGVLALIPEGTHAWNLPEIYGGPPRSTEMKERTVRLK